MAVLSANDRFAVLQRFARELSDNRTQFSVARPDLSAALAGIDDWVDANASSFNQAIPLPARTQLYAKQKAQLLMHVVAKRFEVS